MPKVQILLATYNGEKYLPQQLDSIFAQTYSDFELLVRDDGSTDNTVQVLNEYLLLYSDKMRVITDNLGNLGVLANFSRLAELSDSEYICLSDQDDIWHLEKLAINVEALTSLEQKESKHSPCLVYSDLNAIDDQNKIFYTSVWKAHDNQTKYFVFNRLLIQNIPFGCTMIFNRSLLEMAFPVPEHATMHDHWIALFTAAFGHFFAINKQLVSLRDHGSNVSRKKLSLVESIKKKIVNAFTKSEHEYLLNARIEQAKAFLEYYNDILSSTHKNTLIQFISLERKRGISKKIIYIKNGFFKPRIIETIKMILKS